MKGGFLLRIKLITQGGKRETSTQTCNETMLRDKLKVFVSRISPPLKFSVSLSARGVAEVSSHNFQIKSVCFERLIKSLDSVFGNA